MRTLYLRIVATFILIAIASSVLALLFTNMYYLDKLRTYSEQKVMTISKEIRALYEETPALDLESYLTRIGNMGFQIYAVNEQMEGTFYGAPFKHTAFDDAHVRRVLAGGTYRGLLEERHLQMVTGFFENSIKNTVGLPVTGRGETYALFVRPNLEQQIGEVRILVAVLLGFTFLFSIVFIVFFTRFIVKPVKKLTAATNKIVHGDYDFDMDVSRKDEIGNLARHFTHMAQSLKQLDDMRQEFVANVSHEIKSPLTSIQGFAQAILNKKTTPEEEERYLHIIAEESRRLSSLSGQLLTLATLDKEAHALKRTSFRLDEQIRQVLIVTERQWAEKDLTLDLDLPEVVITADEQLLYQVWFNLIGNGIKFSAQEGTLGVALRVERDIVVTVSDTGSGIRAEDLPHIFARFYKADKARSRSRSGSGLGLSIAKKIVERHRGTIEVASEWGHGTTVTVRLPYR